MKKGMALVLICAGLLFAGCQTKDKTLDWSGLTVDQKETYMTISSNSEAGYDRAIVFYMHLQTDFRSTVEEADSFLKAGITEAALVTSNGETIYSTDKKFNIATAQVDKKSYNLTLMMLPGLDTLSSERVLEIGTLVLTIDGNSVEFPLDRYILEIRETISSDDVYSSMSAFAAVMNPDMTAGDSYGLIPRDGLKIDSFELEYPEEFNELAGIIGYEITGSHEEEDGQIVYELQFQLSEKSDGIMLRPLLKISCSGDEQIEGYIVPSLPVQFVKDE